MALRQWMVPHEWMVKYTPQTEWIERRGMLIWLAEVFTSLGTGLYLVSLFYNSLWGMLVAWLVIILLKIPIHMFYLGKPLRFWRTLPPFTRAWRTSWITRGTLFTTLFIASALIQMTVTRFLPGTGMEVALKVFAGTAALLSGIYSGFVMSYCRSVPLWNSALLPLVLLFAGIADGLALIMAMGLAGLAVNIAAAEAGSRILLSVNAILVSTYLWHATYTSKTARYSATLLLRGSLALPFWGGVVTGGILIPLAISISSLFAGEAATPLLIAAVVLHTMGAFILKHSLLKAGIHSPLLPVTTSSYH